ncbi:MAG: hypothetical protein R2880_06800 [Deinococcales bacterium]
MIKTLKQGLKFASFALLSLVALLSIIATSPQPPNLYYFGIEPNQVCQGDKVKLSWRAAEDTSLYLSGNPLDATEPQFNRMTLDAKGSQVIEVFKDVNLTMESRRGSEKSSWEQVVRLLNQEICESFVVNPIGLYQGIMSQTEPNSIQLARFIILEWYNPLQLYIYEEPTNDYGYHYPAFRLNCGEMDAEANLSCESKDSVGDVLLKFSGTVTPEGFSGSYEGLEKSTVASINFSGTFDFKREF